MFNRQINFVEEFLRIDIVKRQDTHLIDLEKRLHKTLMCIFRGALISSPQKLLRQIRLAKVVNMKRCSGQQIDQLKTITIAYLNWSIWMRGKAEQRNAV